MWYSAPGAPQQPIEPEEFAKFRSPYFRFEEGHWVYRQGGVGAAYAVTPAEVYEGAQNIANLRRQFGWLLGIITLIGLSLVFARDMLGGDPLRLMAIYYAILFFSGFLVRAFARHRFSHFKTRGMFLPPRAVGLGAIGLIVTDGWKKPSVHQGVLLSLVLLPIPLLFLLFYLPVWTLFPLSLTIAFVCAYLVHRLGPEPDKPEDPAEVAQQEADVALLNAFN